MMKDYYQQSMRALQLAGMSPPTQERVYPIGAHVGRLLR